MRLYRKIKTIIGNYKFSTKKYWEQRYANGGNSGTGSYNKLAEFKAEIINDFVKQQNINSIIEFGCGDGNQLSLANYPQYIGLDISETAINKCKQMFKDDKTKSFILYDSNSKQPDIKADLTLSLEVIFHLVENKLFNNYMTHLFNCANKFVIIYSSNFDGPINSYERDRKFTDWINKNKPDWHLLKVINNKYQYILNDPDNTSKSDFYIYYK